jgi:hypothetical protein
VGCNIKKMLPETNTDKEARNAITYLTLESNHGKLKTYKLAGMPRNKTALNIMLVDEPICLDSLIIL